MATAEAATGADDVTTDEAAEAATTEATSAPAATTDTSDNGMVDLSTLTIKAYDRNTGEEVDTSKLYTVTYDGKSHGGSGLSDLLMRWYIGAIGGTKHLYSALDADGNVLIQNVPYYGENGGRFITFEIRNRSVSDDPVWLGDANFDEVMTTPGTIEVRFDAGPKLDPVGTFYGTSEWVPAMTIEARPVSVTWGGTADRRPGDGGSVTASLPAGAVVAGDDVSVEVTGGDAQDEGDHTATARLTGKDAWKYTLANPSQAYVVGSPRPTTPEPTSPEPTSPEPTTPATSPAAATTPQSTPAETTEPSAPTGKKALPQTGDVASAAGIAVAGVSGVITAALGILRRTRE